MGHGRLGFFACAAVAALLLLAVAAGATSPAERLAGALRLETISYESEADFRSEPFTRMHAYLAEQFRRGLPVGACHNVHTRASSQNAA